MQHFRGVPAMKMYCTAVLRLGNKGLPPPPPADSEICCRLVRANLSLPLIGCFDRTQPTNASGSRVAAQPQWNVYGLL